MQWRIFKPEGLIFGVCPFRLLQFRLLPFWSFLYTNYGQIAYIVFQTFNKLTLNTFLTHFFLFYMFALSAMKSRRNGTEVEFECRRNGSMRNGSRRNGKNHRRNGSRRNGSRRNGSDSYILPFLCVGSGIMLINLHFKH